MFRSLERMSFLLIVAIVVLVVVFPSVFFTLPTLTTKQAESAVNKKILTLLNDKTSTSNNGEISYMTLYNTQNGRTTAWPFLDQGVPHSHFEGDINNGSISPINDVGGDFQIIYKHQGTNKFGFSRYEINELVTTNQNETSLEQGGGLKWTTTVLHFYVTTKNNVFFSPTPFTMVRTTN